MAVRPEHRLTYDDYVRLPEGERWEVIDGEGFMVPSPNTRHQEVILELAYRIRRHLETHGGGRVFVAPYDVVLSDFDVFQPDIVFVADRDSDVITEANIRGAPTWIVEVLSPAHPERDTKLKLPRYEAAGVAEYWIVDPKAETVTIRRLEGERYAPPMVLSAGQVAEPLAPDGLTIPLHDLFRTP